VSVQATDTKATRPAPTQGPVWKIILALLFLRLCVGWHFYSEGAKKLAYEPETGWFRVEFSAEGFFRQATGPLAGPLQSQLPGNHNWRQLLAVPVETKPLDEDARYQREDWIAEYNRIEPGKPHEVELFAELLPYSDWAKQIQSDWRATQKTFTDLPMLNDQQREASAAIFLGRVQQLSDYLVTEWDAIELYQHELWRLAKKEAEPEAQAVPFEVERVAAKQIEVRRMPLAWLAGVRGLEAKFKDDLRQVVTPQQRSADVGLAERVDRILTDPQQRRLDWLNWGVAWLIVGVGVCLLLGFFTRLAAVGGVLFLLSVIATQPPWVAGAQTDYFGYQLVELAALVAFAAGVGRYLPGIDYVVAGLWRMCCGKKEVSNTSAV